MEHSSGDHEPPAAATRGQGTDAADSVDHCSGSAEAMAAQEVELDDNRWSQAGTSDAESDDPFDLEEGEDADPAGAAMGMPFGFPAGQTESPSHCGGDNGSAGAAGQQQPQQQQPEQEHWQQHQEPWQQPAAGSNIPKGTVDELLWQLIVKDIM